MSQNLTPKQVAALEAMLENPGATTSEVATVAGVTRETISRWRNHDELFRQTFCDWARDRLSLDVPSVLESLVREARAGNVNASKVVLQVAHMLESDTPNVNVNLIEYRLPHEIAKPTNGNGNGNGSNRLHGTEAAPRSRNGN